MVHDPGKLIIITEGFWMHIRLIRIHHRHYPEVRGEGWSLADAAHHLTKKLTNALDCVHGRDREALEAALADVRAIRPRQQFRALAAAP
jgi:hypothetical protein